MEAQCKRIGIFGGGQLGLMLCEAGHRLGMEMWVLEPDGNCPARAKADHFVQAEYENGKAMADFAKACNVVTFEFENIPAHAMSKLEAAGHKVRPGARALRKLQDRLVEKQFIEHAGAHPAPYARIDKGGDLAPAIDKLGLPAILKTRRFGYDGKGQTVIRKKSEALAAFDKVHSHPSVLESFVPFVREISVIAARRKNGDFMAFPVTENVHREGILRTSTVPAACSSRTARLATASAKRIAEVLGYVGVMAVEFFELEDGTVLVNEIAPRVHNSGHWTRGGAEPDQFEMHLRAICGMELTEPKVKTSVMQNLIGDEIGQADGLTEQGWDVLDYGKHQVRPGRKMGHAVKTS